MAAPRGSWLLGHVGEFTRDPLRLLDACSPPHARLWLGRPVWLLLEPADVVHVLRDRADAYTKGPAFRQGRRLYGNSLLVSEGANHREQSRQVGALFFRHAARHFLGSVAELTECRTRGWHAGMRLDLWAALSELMLALSSRAIFGHDYLPSWAPGGSDESERILRSYDDAMAYVARQNFSAFPLPDWLPVPAVRRYRRAVGTLEGTVAAALARRRTQGDRGGLIDNLADALPDEQVRDQALILTLGGYESATSALCWAMLILNRETEVRRLLVDEMREALGDRTAAPEDCERLPYAQRVLSEVMRLYPPPWLLPRACPGGDRLPSGLSLPAGALLFLSPYKLQRDGRFYHEPLRFNPNRWSEEPPPAGAYFPFGLGSRHCLAESVAWKQLTLILASLCRRWRFTPVGPDLPAPRPVLTLRPPSPLWVRIELA